MKRIVITGAAGQIAYSLLFRIARGEIFGKDQPIAISLLDIPALETGLQGLVMELEDCAFPLLKEVRFGSDPFEMFEGADLALLVGAKPRGPGMERKDLLLDNGKIFIEQGKALDQVAMKEVRTLVVGNPCNTNCLIAMHHAPTIAKEQFFCMTMLDQHRASAQLAKKAGVSIDEVKRVGIWGNHSATQVPDFVNAKIGNKPVVEVISDTPWLETTFVETVQKRGAAVIQARGKSSAASAAHAAIESAKALFTKTKEGAFFSVGQLSKKNPYGIEEDLIFSFPCISDGEGNTEIVSGLNINSFLEEKLQITQKELIEERDAVRHLLK